MSEPDTDEREDIVLVTADSVRRDRFDSMGFLSGLDSHTAITAAHYTRPSLAGLLSSNLLSALRSKVVGPSLPEVLDDHGYTSIGLAPTPQTDPGFGFGAGFSTYETFSEGTGNPLKNRRSRVREYLGAFPLVRRLYRRLVPMEAVLSSLPGDERVVDRAIERFNAASGPRFLWIHLMGTHRPYGTGENALAPELDRRAGVAGNEGLLGSDGPVGGVLNTALGDRNPFDTEPPTERETELIDRTYCEALSRADSQVEHLLGGLEGDPVVAFTADHGDELGEEGYFYHQGFRRRVVDSLVEVPVAFSGIETDHERFSALDIAPTLLGAVGIDVPESWHGNDLADGPSRPQYTIAPWHEKATVGIRDGERTLIARDAEVSLETGDRRARAGRAEVDEELEARLRDLGYADAG